jgi:hypothetical protein
MTEGGKGFVEELYGCQEGFLEGLELFREVVEGEGYSGCGGDA